MVNVLVNKINLKEMFYKLTFESRIKYILYNKTITYRVLKILLIISCLNIHIHKHVMREPEKLKRVKRVVIQLFRG